MTSFEYDAADQVTKVTDPLGRETVTTYDRAGRPVTVTDALGRAASTVYDKAGRPTSVTRADGSRLSWSYDVLGQQTGYTDASGATTSYAYDAAGRQVSATDTAGRVTDFGYDVAGNLITTTHPDGGVATNTYDALGRLVGVDYSDTTPDVSRTYDAASRLVTATAGSSSTSYAYDEAGRTTAVTTDGATVGYAWSDAGLLTGLTYPGGQSVGYERDAAGQLRTVTDWAGREYEYSWTDDGRVDSLTYPNGLVTDYGYDDAGQILGIVTANDAGAQLLAMAYGYDDAGQLTSQTTDRSGGPRAPPAVPVTSTSYTWDALGRLDEATGAQAGRYGFTTADQIAQLADGRTLTYDAAGQVTSLTLPATETQAEQVTTFGYDQRGNRTTTITDGAEVGHTYDLANRLTEVTDETGTSAYTYDATGLRSAATTAAGTEHSTWDTLAAIPLLLSDGAHRYVYGIGSAPLAQVDTTSGETEYLHGDLTGSVRMVTDSEGAVGADADYSPYGTPVAVTSDAVSMLTRFGYAGEYTDPTGYLYLRARYYDPATAQFLTRDPLEDLTTNPYGYTSGNPLQNIDPLGLWGWNPLDWTADEWGTIGKWSARVGAVAAIGVLVVGTGGTAGLVLGLAATTANVVGTAASGMETWRACGVGDEGSDCVGAAVNTAVGIATWGVGSAISREGIGLGKTMYAAAHVSTASRLGARAVAGAWELGALALSECL